MTALLSLFTLLLSIASLDARPTPGNKLSRRSQGTAVVNFGNNTGAPAHLASGLLYGVPDAPDQVPDNFYTDMGFNYLRAGGSQIGYPGRGYIYGVDEYEVRFQSALSNYNTARKYGAPFVLLPSDMYGADGNQPSDTQWPGDNGDFTYYDGYLDKLFSDMRANNMIDGVVFDIWNEPDLGTVFWGRDQSQYLSMWQHTYNRIKNEFGGSVKVSGPSSSGSPSLGNGWWTAFADFISTNNCAPDQYSWHMEAGGGSTMSGAYDGFQATLAQYNLAQPTDGVNINEYALPYEQNPTASVWYIAQLERVNAIGLRGNWLSGGQLHDFFANLLTKTGAPNSYDSTSSDYLPNGQYQVYKYYNQQMTGNRVGTTPSPDLLFDIYATADVSANKAAVLAGTRSTTGSWDIQLDNLSALGLPTDGQLTIHTYGFANNGLWGEIEALVDYGSYTHDYSGDSLTFWVDQTDAQGADTAYVFELLL